MLASNWTAIHSPCFARFTKAVRYATSDASTRKSYDEKTVPQKIVNLLAGEPLIAFAERKGIFTQKGAWDDGSFYRNMSELQLKDLSEAQRQTHLPELRSALVAKQ